MYCRNCGKQLDDHSAFCVYCGAATTTAATNQPGGNLVIDGVQRYDWLTTLLLCFFLGGLGVHSFYTKKTGIGVAQLLTLGGCGVWALVDLIMIITEGYRDGNGNPLVRR
jgi:TM2 domain-containing membrane protein YozV